MRDARLVIAVLLLASCARERTAVAQSQVSVPDVTRESAADRTTTLDGRLVAPAGFGVAYFARDLGGVRFMALGPDGAVYASRPDAGSVVRLEDADGDGMAERRTVAVRGMNQPHGLAFRDGWLYVANTDAVVRVRLGADGTAQGPAELVAEYSGGGGHWTRTVVFGADGGMYVAVGSTCNVCEERNADRAAVLRFDADGRNGRVFARGLRNAVGLAVHPRTGELWATLNERDNLRPKHEDLPPEEINILRDGGDYGWPYCWGERQPNPEYRNARRCATTIPPALMIQAHSAPLGIAFLQDASRFPAPYRGDALVALHGSWNRDTPTGAKVIRIHVRDGRPVSYEDFLTGWQSADGRRWGRPVDVLVHKDGSVLVSDDRGGAIYRVSFAPSAP